MSNHGMSMNFTLAEMEDVAADCARGSTNFNEADGLHVRAHAVIRKLLDFVKGLEPVERGGVARVNTDHFPGMTDVQARRVLLEARFNRLSPEEANALAVKRALLAVPTCRGCHVQMKLAFRMAGVWFHTHETETPQETSLASSCSNHPNFAELSWLCLGCERHFPAGARNRSSIF